MKVTSATIIRQKGGADNVYLHTDLPPTLYDNGSGITKDESLVLHFQSPPGFGEGYVRKHFGSDVRIDVVG